MITPPNNARQLHIYKADGAIIYSPATTSKTTEVLGKSPYRGWGWREFLRGKIGLAINQRRAASSFEGSKKLTQSQSSRNHRRRS